MRVMLLSASGQIGGAERVLLDCVRAGDGWTNAEMSVVALGDGPLVTNAAALGVRTRVVEPPGALSRVGDAFGGAASVIPRLAGAAGSLPTFFRRFSQTVATLEPDVIHSHGVKMHVLGALLARRAPVVWHLHDYVSSRPVSSRLLQVLARRCSLVIAVSESVAIDARACLPAGLPVVVVHNAVDHERFCPDGPALALDTLAGLPTAPAGTVRVGLPATFARWKGHDRFLEAIARLAHPKVRAYVIGEPLYRTHNSQWSRPELEAMVRTLGLEGRVGFTGFVPDMPAAYRALDIVVHASTRPEPFGLVIAEAMACGRAVVATPAGGAAELFEPGVHAISAEPASPDSLLRGIAQLVDDAPARQALGERASAHARQQFSQSRFAADLRAAMRRLAMPARIRGAA